MGDQRADHKKRSRAPSRALRARSRRSAEPLPVATTWSKRAGAAGQGRRPARRGQEGGRGRVRAGRRGGRRGAREEKPIGRLGRDPRRGPARAWAGPLCALDVSNRRVGLSQAKPPAGCSVPAGSEVRDGSGRRVSNVVAFLRAGYPGGAPLWVTRRSWRCCRGGCPRTRSPPSQGNSLCRSAIRLTAWTSGWRSPGSPTSCPPSTTSSVSNAGWAPCAGRAATTHRSAHPRPRSTTSGRWSEMGINSARTGPPRRL